MLVCLCLCRLQDAHTKVDPYILTPPALRLREHYLDYDQCQSRLDGRSGSNACTVIAVSVVMAFLQGHLPTPTHNVSAVVYTAGFVDCMRQENRLYDTCEAAPGRLLGVYDAIHLMPHPGVSVLRNGDRGIRSHEDCCKKLAQLGDKAAAAGQVWAGVMVQMPYSIAVVVTPQHACVLFDSHGHGNKGH